MKKVWLFILFNTGLVVHAAETIFPEDVATFVEKRDSCDHFRGEPMYDEERAAFLVEAMNKACLGTDAELAKLIAKYQDDSKIMATLSDYETSIEIH